MTDEPTHTPDDDARRQRADNEGKHSPADKPAGVPKHNNPAVAALKERRAGSGEAETSTPKQGEADTDDQQPAIASDEDRDVRAAGGVDDHDVDEPLIMDATEDQGAPQDRDARVRADEDAPIFYDNPVASQSKKSARAGWFTRLKESRKSRSKDRDAVNADDDFAAYTGEPKQGAASKVWGDMKDAFNAAKASSSDESSQKPKTRKSKGRKGTKMPKREAPIVQLIKALSAFRGKKANTGTASKSRQEPTFDNEEAASVDDGSNQGADSRDRSDAAKQDQAKGKSTTNTSSDADDLIGDGKAAAQKPKRWPRIAAVLVAITLMAYFAQSSEPFQRILATLTDGASSGAPSNAPDDQSPSSNPRGAEGFSQTADIQMPADADELGPESEQTSEKGADDAMPRLPDEPVASSRPTTEQRAPSADQPINVERSFSSTDVGTGSSTSAPNTDRRTERRFSATADGVSQQVDQIMADRPSVAAPESVPIPSDILLNPGPFFTRSEPNGQAPGDIKPGDVEIEAAAGAGVSTASAAVGEQDSESRAQSTVETSSSRDDAPGDAAESSDDESDMAQAEPSEEQAPTIPTPDIATPDPVSPQSVDAAESAEATDQNKATEKASSTDGQGDVATRLSELESRLEASQSRIKALESERRRRSSPPARASAEKPDIELMAISIARYCDSCTPLVTVKTGDSTQQLTEGDTFRGYRVEIQGDRLLLTKGDIQHSYYPGY